MLIPMVGHWRLMIETAMRKALRCRACGSDWEQGRCRYCGHDEFVDVTRFYPGFAGPAKAIMTVTTLSRPLPGEG